MSYNSKHTGAEVDALLDKAGSAVQPENLATVAKSGSYNDLSNKPTIPAEQVNADWNATSGKAQILNKPTIPDISGKVDKVVGKQLSTEDFTSALKSKLEGLSNYDDAELSNAVSALRKDFDELVSGDTTTAIKTFNEVIAFLDGVQDTQDLSSIIASIEQQIAGKMDKVILSAVATSGSYNDLKDKPTIPSAVTENTVSGWGFTKNAGTVTGVKINGSTKSPSSGTVDIGNVVTSIKINGSTKSPSNGVVDLGTVITAHQTLKTINGQSIVGSGDITISGGGEEYAEPYLVDYGGGGMGACFAIEDDINSPMLPDVTYICPVPVMAVWVQTLQPPTGNVGKYTFHFNVGNDGAMVYIDESILMAGTCPETLESNVSCELSIIATKIGNTYTYKAVLTSFS